MYSEAGALPGPAADRTGPREVVPAVRTGSDASTSADEAVEALYAAHWTALVRLAALLLHDTRAAEDVTQDAFVAMHGRWDRLREPDRALAYLRRSVVNGCRSRQRRSAVAARHRPEPPGDAASAESAVLATERRKTVLAAVGRLPRRQREVLVLRHWLDLSEADIAATLGISRGSVKSHSSRGLDNLRKTLEHDT